MQSVIQFSRQLNSQFFNALINLVTQPDSQRVSSSAIQ